MTTNAQKFFEQVLTLPPADRAELATRGEAEADGEDWRPVLDEIQRDLLAR